MSSARAGQPGSDTHVTPAQETPWAYGFTSGRTADGPAKSVELEAGKSAAAGVPAGKNVSVQCLRGLAALSVVLFHASGYAKTILGSAGSAAVFGDGFGIAGVAVFFAISGVLMAELIQRNDPWRFLAHRIVRIYPPYLLAAAVAVPVIGLLGIRKFGPHIFSLMLAPVGPRTYYLSIEWTLVFECTYYVALFLIGLAGWHRYLNRIALAWLAATFSAPLFVGWDDFVFCNLGSIWLSPANAAFAFGLLVPWIAGRIRIPPGTGVLAVCIFIAAVPANMVIARWGAGAAAALLVLDAVRFKAPQRRPMLQNMLSGLSVLGDWSYALYLIHPSCFTVVYYFWPRSASVDAAWPLAVATALVVSAGFGMVDVRTYRYLRNAADALGEKERRRRVNLYAGLFISAALVGAFVR